MKEKRKPQLVKRQRSPEHWMSSPHRYMCSIAAVFKTRNITEEGNKRL